MGWLPRIAESLESYFNILTNHNRVPFYCLHAANIREISEIAKIFPVLTHRCPTDFRDEVAGDAIALPKFWPASGACAFVLKSSFNSLYAPFGSPRLGDRNLREEEENRPTRCSNRYAIRLADQSGLARLCGMGPPGVERRFANI